MDNSSNHNNAMDYITARLGSEGSPMLAFGGDYNPEQWPEEIWDEDVRADARGRRQPGQRRHLLLGPA